MNYQKGIGHIIIIILGLLIILIAIGFFSSTGNNRQPAENIEPAQVIE